MRFASDDARGVLSGSFSFDWFASLHYNGVRRLESVPIADVRFREDGNAKIQQSGSCRVVWSDEFATSVAPVNVADPFAPFGAQLHVFVVVTVGSFSARVEFGRFEIVDVPSARDEQMWFQGQLITVGSVVELQLSEVLAGVGQESFDAPSAPPSLGSTWGELGRITGLPLLRTVPDAPISRSIMYPDSKLDAAYELADVMLDAVLHVTPVGALSARPKVWPAPVDTIGLDAILDFASGMSSEQVYNRAVVRATGGDQATVLAVAEVESGPLRVREPDGSASPFRARTRYLASEFVTTRDQARPWAESELARVSTLRTRVVSITELFNPLRERGDVVLVEREDVFLVCRVVTIDRGGSTQSVTAEVGGSVPRTVKPGPFDAFYAVHGVFPSHDLFRSDDLFPEA